MNRLPPALLLAGLLSLALSSPVFAGVCDDVTWGQATGPVALAAPKTPPIRPLSSA